MVYDVWDYTDMASGFSYTYPVFVYPFSLLMTCFTSGKDTIWLMALSWLVMRPVVLGGLAMLAITISMSAPVPLSNL